MPPFTSTSKMVGSLILRRNGVRHLVKYSGNGKLHQIQSISGIAGIETPLIRELEGSKQKQDVCSPSSSSLMLSNVNNVQRRQFLGVGDGEEGNVLSKVYEERRVLGYSPEQLFNVVAAVDLYQDFLPWCRRSDILRQYPDGSFDAELEIGFKFFVESYVSHVELERSKRVKTTASDTTLFDHLINIWEFSPGPGPGTCNLYFLVDFKFQSPLYRQVASIFFREVVSRLVGSFGERCRLIYGPGVPVLENSYEQST